MPDHISEIELSEDLSRKITAAGIVSVTDLVARLSDPIFVECLGLEYAEVEELNSVFKSCGVMTILVPVGPPLAAGPVPRPDPLTEGLASIIALLTQAVAEISERVGASTPLLSNPSAEENRHEKLP
jgi:hypothetical protein